MVKRIVIGLAAATLTSTTLLVGPAGAQGPVTCIEVTSGAGKPAIYVGDEPPCQVKQPAKGPGILIDGRIVRDSSTP